MEIQIRQNSQGSKNLYFGHPFSRETYTNSLQLKTALTNWETDLEDIYSGKHLFLEPMDSWVADEIADELRVIRGTKVMFIGDYSLIEDMQEDIGIYHDLCSKALVRIANPDFMEFETYTKRILNDRMKSVFDLKSVSPEQAKKYMDYVLKYDEDKKYSDRLLVKSYFYSTDRGVLILTDDFVDYNLQLKIDPETGVVGCEFWLSENTSKYTKHYKEV